jgi:hypothetical protein
MYETTMRIVAAAIIIYATSLYVYVSWGYEKKVRAIQTTFLEARHRYPPKNHFRDNHPSAKPGAVHSKNHTTHHFVYESVQEIRNL